MGRPAMGLKRTHVSLPIEALSRIESLVGDQKVSAFIREAVDEKLERLGIGASPEILSENTITLPDGMKVRITTTLIR